MLVESLIVTGHFAFLIYYRIYFYFKIRFFFPVKRGRDER